MSDYNGWSNYETWCVSLWLSNDEGYYNLTREMAETFAADYDDDAECAWRFAEGLKAFVDDLPEVEAVQSGPATFVVDLLGSALGHVDWAEIAHNFLTEV